MVIKRNNDKLFTEVGKFEIKRQLSPWINKSSLYTIKVHKNTKS